jgi:hypothetical protein
MLRPLPDDLDPGLEKTSVYQEQLATGSAKTEPAATGKSVLPAMKIGRYQLLELVGAGGMGMVWSAWDPELERRVALKLVKVSSRESRDRMLREGQLLARLSHPNVVPIFDVGEMGDQIYLVMEFVRGTTLRAFAATSPGSRAIVDAFRQAGLGLVAAHGAGVIHRDFKPDNAIRGDDGRVRVLDFGLAHSGNGNLGADGVAGTPAYMAPEQKRGDELTAACDQYSFAVSLREALIRGGTLPKRIAAIVERGTAARPDQRFPSMRALLDALDRDPARRWRRAALGVAVAGAAAGAFAIGRSGTTAPAIEPCSGGPAELAESWPASRRAELTRHLASLGPLASVEIEQLARELDGYGKAWVGAHHQACMAHQRKELLSSKYEVTRGCLLRSRAQLAAVGELLASVPLAGLPEALQAARSLPDAHACEDSGAIDPPPVAVADRVREVSVRVERALVRGTAGDKGAITEAHAAVAEARPTMYKPLIARALLAEGRAALAEDPPRALAALDEAWQLALQAFDEPVAVEAFARWLFADTAVEQRGTTTAAMWPVMDFLAARIGGRGRFARALLYNNVALQHMVAGDKPEETKRLLERAWTIAGEDPEIELVSIQRNLAMLEPTRDAAERRLRDALARQRTVLGVTHPETLLAQVQVAAVTRPHDEARMLLEDACRGFERWQQPRTLFDCQYETGWLLDESGDPTAARAWMKRVAETPDEVAGMAWRGLERRRLAAAYVALEPTHRGKIEQIAKMKQTPWDRLLAGDAEVILASHAVDVAAADAAWQRALIAYEQVAFVAYKRRLAFARAIVAERSPPGDRAKQLATSALDWYRGVRGEEARVARLQRIVER